jgi:uncharacterized OB-fold protein
VTDTTRFDESLATFPVFETQDERVRLRGSQCGRCGHVSFPARVICLECGGEHAPRLLSGRGVVYSVTTLANPPVGFDEGFPYLAVDLIEGPRVLAPGIPHAGLQRGSAVEAVPAAVRDGALGFRFEVVDA